MQLYLAFEIKIIFFLTKIAIIKIYNRIKRFNSFDVNLENRESKNKLKISQNEINAKLFHFFKKLKLNMKSQFQPFTISQSPFFQYIPSISFMLYYDN